MAKLNPKPLDDKVEAALKAAVFDALGGGCTDTQALLKALSFALDSLIRQGRVGRPTIKEVAMLFGRCFREAVTFTDGAAGGGVMVTIAPGTENDLWFLSPDYRIGSPRNKGKKKR